MERRERRNKIATRLRVERLKLRGLLASAVDLRLADEPGEGRRRADCLSRDELRSLSFDHRAELLRRLHQIDEALQQLAAGTYGRCIDCGARIGRKRLTKDPAATRCNACKSTFGDLRLPQKLQLYIHALQ